MAEVYRTDPAVVTVDGLREFVTALRKVDKDLAKSFRNESRKAAVPIVADAKARYRRLPAGLGRRAARALTIRSDREGVQIIGGRKTGVPLPAGKSGVVPMGALEFGSRGYPYRLPQIFGSYAGSGGIYGRSYGRALFPALRRGLPDFQVRYAAVVEDVMNRTLRG